MMNGYNVFEEVWHPADSRRPVSAPRNWLVWRCMVVGILCLVVVSGCGIYSVAERVRGTSSDSVASRGVPVRDGRFRFVVTDFTKVDAQAESLSRGESFVVLVYVTNIGDEPHSLIVGNQKSVDAAGHGYAPRGMAASHLNHETAILEIATGASAQVGIRFDVPVGTRLTAVELHDSASSRGATINL